MRPRHHKRCYSHDFVLLLDGLAYLIIVSARSGKARYFFDKKSSVEKLHVPWASRVVMHSRAVDLRAIVRVCASLPADDCGTTIDYQQVVDLPRTLRKLLEGYKLVVVT